MDISSTNFIVYLAALFLKFAIAPGLSGGRGEMAMAVASHARLVFFVVRSAPVVRRSLDAFPFCSLYSDSPLSSRPQPLGSVGDDTPCEESREDFGLPFKL